MDLLPDNKENLMSRKKYPKSVWCIVINELCERFSYYGFRTVLVLYLTTILKFNGDNSTIIYHGFVFLSYFMPLFGAILADLYWGKFKTIMRLSIVYALGSMVLTSSSMADMFSLQIQRIISFVGLFFISVGTGGIKPCVFAFGGDQFQLPRQEKQLQHFTTKFVIAINVGALMSTFLTPELRKSVNCFGHDTCYPLAFGVPTALMFIAIMIFVVGKNVYVRKSPECDAIPRTFGCIFYAFRKKICSSVDNRSHWLDHAKGAYSDTEISDTRTALNVIAVFMAYPIFWALYEQQGSRWTLQATLMDGRLPSLGWTIKPDQMQMLIPFFGLIFLVVFDVILYPLLAKVGVRNPLQKLTLSGCLAVVAFVLSALVQFKIFGNTTVIPIEEGRINVYNGFDCKAFVSWPLSRADDRLEPFKAISINYTPTSSEDIVRVTVKFDPLCTSVSGSYELNTTMTVVRGKAISYYLTRGKQNTISLNRIGDYDDLVKDKNGQPSLRLIVDDTFDRGENITLASGNKISYSYSSLEKNKYEIVEMGQYDLFYNEKLILSHIDLIPATLYTITVQQNGNKTDSKLFATDEGNYVHILWQLPQFLCMILADVIFVVTDLEFAFTEAPVNIKSFISAINLLTTSIGNLLVVIISAWSFKNQAHEYLFYAGLMIADTVLLAYFSIKYRNRHINNNKTSEPNHEEENTQF